MKKFAKELITNRFGIVLAALNICYLVSNKFIGNIFAHHHGEKCFYYKKHFIMFFTRADAPHLELLINSPSAVVSAIQGSLVLNMFPNLCTFTQLKIQTIFFVFFVAFQWLFIAWLSYKIAGKIGEN